MDESKISIIIPVYNTSRYLSNCLKSVINQDYRNLEIILVNDASTDNSLAVCQKYAAADNRIKIINKEINEGLELARRSGLEIASGEYIMHVDSDDWLSNRKVVSSMYLKAEETGADYVEINSVKTIDRFGLYKRIIKKEKISGLIEKPELFDKYYISFFGCLLLEVNMWGKLYRKSVIDSANILPQGITIGEDVAYNLQLFPYLKKIYVMNSVGYCYRYGGMMSKYIPQYLSDSKKIYSLRKNMIGRYQYEKAESLMNKELKEILKADIQQRIRFKQSKEDIIKFLSEEITDTIYSNIVECYRKINIKDPFVTALKEKNILKMYEICYKIEQKLKWRIKFVMIASKILNIF